ncbi:MAG: hypothetical protein WCE23_16540 [Candidatus Binatus sp.]|uniref:hypothetical protein n=1 Tax=Candidatus Binatus sp. TaxID=2811406 RepID=UPI003C7448C7
MKQKQGIDKGNAKFDFINAISGLRGMVNSVARGGHICHSLRRELTAAHREAILDTAGRAVRGIFTARQEALIEEIERFRDVISDLGSFSAAETLRLMMILRGEGKSEDRDPELGRQHKGKAGDAFRIAVAVLAEWGKLSRLCELEDLSRAFSADAPDLVAEAATRAIPCEERIASIVAAGTTCVAFLEEFCDYRGIHA